MIGESIAGDYVIRVTDETENDVEVTFTVEPKIEFSDTEGPPETEVEVAGTGFGYRANLNVIDFDSDDITGDISGDDRSDSSGIFVFKLIVPTTLGSGTYTLEVEDDEENSAEADFTIVITSDIDKTSGAIGDTLTITGSGFTPGTFSIILTVGTYTDTFTFTMESEASRAPTLIAPIIGSEVEQPVTFDWSDVTDDSDPVKYVWQISLDANFTTLVMA